MRAYLCITSFIDCNPLFISSGFCTMLPTCFYFSVSFFLTLLFVKEYRGEGMSVCFSFILDRDSQSQLSS